jgi:hypothetical protein
MLWHLRLSLSTFVLAILIHRASSRIDIPPLTMKHISSILLPSALLALLLSGQAALAQDVHNDGAEITITGGATLYIPGNLTSEHSGKVTTTGASTLRVDGNLTNSASSTLDMGTGGTVEVHGNFTNAPGATVTPGTGTLLMKGSTAAQALDAGDASFYNLTINNTAGTPLVTVPSNVTVTNQLTLTTGMLRTTAATKVALTNGATLSGETNGRFVAGNLEAQRSGVSGNSPLAFANGMSLTPNTNMGVVTVTRTAGLATSGVSYGVNPLDNNKKGIDQIWTVVTSTQPSAGTPLRWPSPGFRTTTTAWAASCSRGCGATTAWAGRPWVLT